MPSRAAVLVAGLCAGLFCPHAWAQAPPAKPEFLVSSFDLGATDHPRLAAQQLASQLQDEGWCTAKSATAASAWNQVPAGADVSKWVSIVTAGFHERSEAYAFMFDGPSGAVSLAAHVGHRKFYSRGAMQWAPPFEKLLGGLQVEYRNRSRNSRRPLLGIKIVQIAPLPEQTSAVLDKGSTVADEALTLPPEKVFPPLEAIIFAAAYEAGWAPTPRDADASALVEVRVRDQACALRVTFTRQGSKRVVAKDRVAWEEYQEQLVRIFEMPSLGDDVQDFARLGNAPLHILAATPERLYAIVDDELTAYDLALGKPAWRIQLPQSKLPTVPKRIERYTARHDRSGKLHIYRYSKALAEIDLIEGKESVLAPAAVASPWAFDADDGVAATVSGMTVNLYRGGVQAWTKSEGYAVTSGPTLTSDCVIAGTAKGELFALSLIDGRELWRTPLGGRLHGPVALVGGQIIAFSYDEEAIYAVQPSVGKLLWKRAVGDAILEPPALAGARLCIVTKSNRILLLNPADGSIAKETTWPTWLVSVAPIGGPQKLLACTDIDGNVTLLSQDTLAQVSRVNLPLQLTSGVAFVPKMRALWPGNLPARQDEILAAIDDAAAATKSMLLVADQEGFLYMISVPAMK